MAANDSSSDAWDIFMGGAAIAAGLYLIYKLFSNDRCPHCNYPVDPADKYCPNCNIRL
ncbi:MAG: zinc ribbon domain-containing protein [Desulfobacterales bacterium]|nr:zinc ribbon domain-containing protein [Desulfobacterales bacterium]